MTSAFSLALLLMAVSAPGLAAAVDNAAEAARRRDAWAHAAIDKGFSRHSPNGDAALGDWGPSARDARDFADGAAPRGLQGTCASVASAAAGQCGAATACTATGTAAYTTRALAYNTATGVFSGTITTNQCPHIGLESTYLGVLRTTQMPALSCVKQCVPVLPSLTTSAASLRGPA